MSEPQYKKHDFHRHAALQKCSMSECRELNESSQDHELNVQYVDESHVFSEVPQNMTAYSVRDFGMTNRVCYMKIARCVCACVFVCVCVYMCVCVRV